MKTIYHIYIYDPPWTDLPAFHAGSCFWLGVKPVFCCTRDNYESGCSTVILWKDITWKGMRLDFPWFPQEIVPQLFNIVQNVYTEFRHFQSDWFHQGHRYFFPSFLYSLTSKQFAGLRGTGSAKLLNCWGVLYHFWSFFWGKKSKPTKTWTKENNTCICNTPTKYQVFSTHMFSFLPSSTPRLTI